MVLGDFYTFSPSRKCLGVIGGLWTMLSCKFMHKNAIDLIHSDTTYCHEPFPIWSPPFLTLLPIPPLPIALG